MSSDPRRLINGRIASRLQLTSNDTAFMIETFYDRVVARDQAIRLGFWHSVGRANVRLLRLTSAGFLRRYTPPFSSYGSQSLYALGLMGCPLVATATDLDLAHVRRIARVSETPQWVEHSLRIVDAKIVLCDSLSRAGTLVSWRAELQARHEYRLSGATTTTARVFRPDAYLRLQKPGGRVRHVFLEIDMGHSSSAAIAEDIAAYVDYRDYVFPETYGASSFEVLWITTGERRRGHMLETATKMNETSFLFATFADLQQFGAIAPIWHRPGSALACSLGDLE